MAGGPPALQTATPQQQRFLDKLGMTKGADSSESRPYRRHEGTALLGEPLGGLLRPIGEDNVGAGATETGKHFEHDLVWSKYSSDFGARDLISHSRATGTIDDWHKTPIRFGKVDRNLRPA